MPSFDVFFDPRLNKRLSKQSRRHCAHYDATVMVMVPIYDMCLKEIIRVTWGITSIGVKRGFLEYDATNVYDNMRHFYHLWMHTCKGIFAVVVVWYWYIMICNDLTSDNIAFLNLVPISFHWLVPTSVRLLKSKNKQTLEKKRPSLLGTKYLCVWAFYLTFRHLVPNLRFVCHWIL